MVAGNGNFTGFGRGVHGIYQKVSDYLVDFPSDNTECRQRLQIGMDRVVVEAVVENGAGVFDASDEVDIADGFVFPLAVAFEAFNESKNSLGGEVGSVYIIAGFKSAEELA